MQISYIGSNYALDFGTKMTILYDIYDQIHRCTCSRMSENDGYAYGYPVLWPGQIESSQIIKVFMCSIE